MFTTLEELPSHLSQMYNEIPTPNELPWISHQSIQQFACIVDNASIEILVTMDRIQNPTPKTETVSAEKMFKDTVSVNITPSIGIIWQVVGELFKNQQNAQSKRVFFFDSVKINGTII